METKKQKPLINAAIPKVGKLKNLFLYFDMLKNLLETGQYMRILQNKFFKGDKSAMSKAKLKELSFDKKLKAVLSSKLDFNALPVTIKSGESNDPKANILFQDIKDILTVIRKMKSGAELSEEMRTAQIDFFKGKKGKRHKDYCKKLESQFDEIVLSVLGPYKEPQNKLFGTENPPF